MEHKDLSLRTPTRSCLAKVHAVIHKQVLLDGRDIRGLPLSWLRQQIGLASQEPCLFQTSIYNNIAYCAPPWALPQLS